MKIKTVEPERFTLALTPLGNRIMAGKIRVVTDGKSTWGKSIGKMEDVTSDFYHVIFALADMNNDKTKQGDFTFSNQSGETYQVTVKEITPTNEKTKP